MNKIRSLVVMFLISLVCSGQEIPSFDEFEVYKQDKDNKILIIPFENKMYASAVDNEIAAYNRINYIDVKEELKKGTRLNQIMRHTLGLFHGQTGASYWKKYLSENMCVRDADVKKIDHIMDKIKYNNVDTRVGQSA